MRTLILNGFVYRNNYRRFDPCDILIEDGIVLEVAKRGSLSSPCDKIIDAEGKRIVPGLVDVHTHGIGGYDFLSANEDALQKMSDIYRAHGVTCVMPTLASATLDEMLAAAKRIKKLPLRLRNTSRLCLAWIRILPNYRKGETVCQKMTL